MNLLAVFGNPKYPSREYFRITKAFKVWQSSPKQQFPLTTACCSKLKVDVKKLTAELN